MTVVLARLDPAVPLRHTVHHTNNHQTLTALALICDQVNVYNQKIKNPPPGFDKWEIDMNNHKPKVEWDKKVTRKPRKPRWEVHLRTLLPCYDQNTYHYRDVKLRLNSTKAIVAEWKAAVTKFTELTPHLHYGTSS